MLSGGCSQEGAQMLMTDTMLHNINDTKKKLDCGTYPYHDQEGTPLLEGLNNVGHSLEPCFHVAIVMQ